MKKALPLVVTFLTALPCVFPGEEIKKPASPAGERFRLSDLLPTGFQKNPRLTLSIVTEMTPAGKAITPPTRDKPVYYVIMDGGFVEEGDVVAGDKPPNPAKLAQIMESSLARSGYQPASETHPPTQFIHYRWGVFNHLTGLTENEESEPLVFRNLQARAALVGGSEFAAHLMRAVRYRHMGDMARLRLDARMDLLATLATSDLYFLLAVAYDGEAARRGEKKVLWTTRVSTDSNGLAMNDSLPALVTNAGGYFGQDTKGSVIFHPRLFEGKVEMGDPTVVPDAPASPQPAPSSERKAKP